MDWKKEYRPLLYIVGVFLALFFLPIESIRLQGAIVEAFALAKWYAREHVILCLVPAFFIAGAITVFVSQNSVMKYLGPAANKVVAYGVASTSGTILAVCSCTVLPLFAGIYRMGAGLGPAAAFLYSGPAINILAIILTARILGPELGIARAVGAIVFAVVIGLLMHFIFRKEEKAKVQAAADLPDAGGRPLYQTVIFIGLQVGILIFATWSSPEGAAGLWGAVYAVKWSIVTLFTAGLSIVLIRYYSMSWWKVTLAFAPAAAIMVLAPFASSAGGVFPGIVQSPLFPMLVFWPGRPKNNPAASTPINSRGMICLVRVHVDSSQYLLSLPPPARAPDIPATPAEKTSIGNRGDWTIPWKTPPAEDANGARTMIAAAGAKARVTFHQLME